MGNRRITATLGSQIITGVTNDRNAHNANVIELWVDGAIGAIQIDTSEWKVEIGDFWRVIPEFPNYEMSEFGTVRNKKTLRIIRKKVTGGIFCVDLRDGNKNARTRSVAKLFRQIFPDHVEERQIELPRKDEDLCEWVAVQRKGNSMDSPRTRTHCVVSGPHKLHKFVADHGAYLERVMDEQNKSRAKSASLVTKTIQIYED